MPIRIFYLILLLYLKINNSFLIKLLIRVLNTIEKDY